MFERDIAAVGVSAPTVAEVHARVAAQSSDAFEAQWKENREAHPHAIEAWPHVDALIGLFAGAPAICIGTGPSVVATLPAIAKASRHAITVACPSAVKYCLAAGFAPTFVPFVEPKFVAQVAEGFPPTSNVLLDYRAHDSYYAMESLQRFVFGHDGDEYARRARALCSRRTLLPESPSTLGAAFSFAVLMGCHPVVVAGADFSFDGGMAHPPGHYAESYYPTDDGWTFAGKDGKEARANWVLLAHRDWFQNWIPRYVDAAKRAGRELAVIDATPRGLGLPGATACVTAPALLLSGPPLTGVQGRIDEAALQSTMFAHTLAFERQCLQVAA